MFFETLLVISDLILVFGQNYNSLASISLLLFESIVCLMAQLQKMDLGLGRIFYITHWEVMQGTRGMVKGAVSIHKDVTERLLQAGPFRGDSGADTVYASVTRSSRCPGHSAHPPF